MWSVSRLATVRPARLARLAVALAVGSLGWGHVRAADAVGGATGLAELTAHEPLRAAWRQSQQSEQAQDYPAAIAALAHLPESYLVHLRLGWLYYASGQYPPALGHYQAALERAPESLEASLGCLLPLLALERFREAESRARRILEQHPANYYAHLRLAYALRRQGKSAPAESVLERLLERYPSDPAALTELGLVKIARGQNAAARRLFADVLVPDPENQTALEQLGSPRFYYEPHDEPRPDAAVPLPGATAALRPPDIHRSVRLTASAYYAYTDYQRSLYKAHAHSTGLHAHLGIGSAHAFEVEVDRLDLHYHALPTLRQWDATLAYANYSVPHLKLRLGGHYLASEDPWTDQGWVAFAGAHSYGRDRWEAGLDAAFSKYPNYPEGLDVVQLDPRLGVALWRSPQTALRAELRAYWIHPTRALTGQRDLFSLEPRLSLDWRRWTCSAFGWVGEQVFALRQDGFLLFNLAEEHQGGYGAEVRRALSSQCAFTLRASREQFTDWGASVRSYADTYLLLLTVRF